MAIGASDRPILASLHHPRVTPIQSMTRSAGLQQTRNIIANWGAFALSAVTGLFLSPFVVRQLGAESYGLWTIIGSLTGSLGLFDLGLRSAAVRFISRYHARGDHEEASKVAGHLLVLFSLTAACVLATGAVLVWRLEAAFNLPASLVLPGRVALAMSVVSLAIGLVNSVAGGVLIAMERLDTQGFSDMAFELLRVSAVLLVLGAGGGLVGLAAIGLTLSALRFGVLRWLAKRTYPELRWVPRRPDKASLKTILDVSLFSTLIYTSVTLSNQAGTLIIGAMLPLTLAAQYAIGATLPVYAALLNRPVAQTVHPRASRLEAAGDAQGLRQLILGTGKISSLVLLPMALTFIIRGESFIGIWQGEAFRVPSGSVLAILAVGVFLTAPRHVIQATFVASGRHRTLSPWYIAEALLRIAATFALVRPMGIQGPAWATTVPNGIVACLVMPQLCHTRYGLSKRTMAMQLWLRPLAAMVPFALALLAIEHWWSAQGYLLFFGQIALALPLAVGGAFAVGLDSSERKSALAMIGARLPWRLSREGASDTAARESSNGH